MARRSSKQPRAESPAPNIAWLRQLRAILLILLVFFVDRATASALGEMPHPDAGPQEASSANAASGSQVEQPHATSNEGGHPDAVAPRAPYPVILVHGFSGFADVGPVDYFFGVVDDLRRHGEHVFTPALPPYRGSKERARTLARHIDQALDETGSDKVHLIAHSQGGIDARALLGLYPRYQEKVFSITTIGTPHHGTPIADEALSTPDAILFPAGDFLSWLLGFTRIPPEERSWDANLNGIPKELKGTNLRGPRGSADWDPRLREAIYQLSSIGMKEFNRSHPPPEDVHLFSVAAYSNLRNSPQWCARGELFPRTERVDVVDFWLFPSAMFLAGNRLSHPIANDGVVPSESMVWERFLGCIPADHFDEVGLIGDTIPHLVSGFDHRKFYRTLTSFLRELEEKERHDDGMMPIEPE